MNLLVRGILFSLLVFGLFGCPEKPKTAAAPEPDYLAIQQKVNRLLNRDPTHTFSAQETSDKTSQIENLLQLCESPEGQKGCDKRTLSGYHLLLGDLHFDAKNYQKAIEHYQQQILLRYEAFESDSNEHNFNMKINRDEKAKKGDSPHLKAGGFFLESRFSMLAFQDYAEMVRGERRIQSASRESGDAQNSETAKSRAEMGLQKAMEYRRTFEKNKRSLLAIGNELGKDFTNYYAHIQSWETQLEPKLI